MSYQELYHYTVKSFDEAVERLVQLRESDASNHSQIDFEFSTENLPKGLLAEYQAEAKLAGIAVAPSSPLRDI